MLAKGAAALFSTFTDTAACAIAEEASLAFTEIAMLPGRYVHLIYAEYSQNSDYLCIVKQFGLNIARYSVYNGEGLSASTSK